MLWFFRLSFAFALLGCYDCASAGPLTLYLERASPTDLEVQGRLGGVAPGQSRFLRRSELVQLPSRELTLTGEFVSGEQKVTVVFLQDLIAHLPAAPEADMLLAYCKDGYMSVFPFPLVAAYRPFLVLKINGVGPEKWPPPGLTFDPGPYVISYTPSLAPEQRALLDPGHKKPWGVVRLEFARTSERFSGAFTGRWGMLSPRAQEGREVWINSCACCHAGPNGMPGGTKSDRPFQVLAAYAEFSPAYFKRYVREPQVLNPCAKMEGHPHYTDGPLDALIAFILAEPPLK